MPYADLDVRREYNRRYQSEWAKNNPEKREAYWLKRDKKKMAERAREWRAKNKDKVRQNNLKWRLANPDRINGDIELKKKRLLIGAKARALASGIEFSITKDDLEWPTHCPMLGCELDYFIKGGAKHNSPSIDRIDPALGYVPGNVQVLSWRANRLKCDAARDELVKLARFILSQ